MCGSYFFHKNKFDSSSSNSSSSSSYCINNNNKILVRKIIVTLSYFFLQIYIYYTDARVLLLRTHNHTPPITENN